MKQTVARRLKVFSFSAGANYFADGGITYVSWNPSGNYTLIIPIQRRYFCYPNTCNKLELRAVFDRDIFGLNVFTYAVASVGTFVLTKRMS